MATVQTATRAKLVRVLVMVVIRRRLSISSWLSAASSRLRSRRTAARAIQETTTAVTRMIAIRTPDVLHQAAEKVPSDAANRPGTGVDDMARPTYGSGSGRASTGAVAPRESSG